MEVSKIIQSKVEYYPKKNTSEVKQTELVKSIENKSEDNTLDIKKIVSKINNNSINFSLNFSTDEKTGEKVIRFIDEKTKTTIKQIPSEDTLKVIEEIDKFIERNNLKIKAGTIFSKEV